MKLYHGSVDEITEIDLKRYERFQLYGRMYGTRPHCNAYAKA